MPYVYYVLVFNLLYNVMLKAFNLFSFLNSISISHTVLCFVLIISAKRCFKYINKLKILFIMYCYKKVFKFVLIIMQNSSPLFFFKKKITKKKSTLRQSTHLPK